MLQRLAVQGAEIEARDVIVAGSKDPKENSEEQWSVIELNEEHSFLDKENINLMNRSKQRSAMNQIKGATSVFSFITSHKPGKNRTERSIFDSPALNMDSRNELERSKGKESEGRSILMEETGPPESMKESFGPDKLKRKPFRSLFQREGLEAERSGKKQWGFDGFKKWKKSESEDETASSQVFSRTLGEGPDTKLIKKKLHSDGSPSDFFIDKVWGPSSCSISESISLENKKLVDVIFCIKPIIAYDE